MYEVRGIYAGVEVTVTWDDGRLSGHESAVYAAGLRARSREGQPVGPVCGPYTYTEHLQSPLSALFILEGVFDRIDEATGDLPEIPETPGVN